MIAAAALSKVLGVSLGVSLLAHLGAGLWIHKLRADVATAKADTTTAETERDGALQAHATAAATAASCLAASHEWEATVLAVQQALGACQAQFADLSAQGRAASARAAAADRQLAQALAELTARGRRAAANLTCAAVWDLRIADVCPEARP